MRDRLIHRYDEVDIEVVWTTLEEDVPALISEVERFAPSLELEGEYLARASRSPTVQQ